MAVQLGWGTITRKTTDTARAAGKKAAGSGGWTYISIEQEQPIEILFKRGEANADELQGVVDEVLAELRDPGSESAQLAQQAGLDPKMLAGTRVYVSEGQQGMEPVITTIAVGFAFGAAATSPVSSGVLLSGRGSRVAWGDRQ